MNISSTRLHQHNKLTATGASLARPQADVQPSEVPSHSLDEVSLEGLRELAGVKKPGFLKRLMKTASNFVTGINLALAIGPTVGHLILAKEISEIQSKVTGNPPQAPLDWMREHRPKGFGSSLSSILQAGSAPLQSAMGLSLTDLAEVEEHYYRVLAPSENAEGVKSTAPYLRELAKDPQRGPDQARSAFVWLGEKRTDEAKTVTDLWNSPERPRENPFPVEEPRHRIWESLQSQEGKGNLPIFVDIDGDYYSFTGTEFVAKKTLSSLGERNNSLGDDFADTSRYFAWLTARQESYSRDLAPYLRATNPKAAGTVEQIKRELTPPWLDGAKGMGPFTDPGRASRLPAQLDSIRREQGENAWVDSLISLDRDVITGVQTHWIKLLRELKRSDREGVVEALPSALFDYNLRLPGQPGFAEVAPQGAPILGEVARQQEFAIKDRPFDRAIGLKEILDHTLDGLGVIERRETLQSIRQQANSHLKSLETRESRLRASLGNNYAGLNVRDVIDGNVPEDKFKVAVRQLNEQADRQGRTPLGLESRRHASMLEFLYKMETRYGEVDQIMPRIKGDFTQHPLGISEYFIPPAPGALVSPLREVEPVSVLLGNSQDPDPMKLSLVLEGGGGRGFAYPECLKQLEGSFIKSEHGYEIDEYVGTSAGSLVAVLLAAGFQISEVRSVMDTIDFTSFNADAAWLMGGVDPKARGINRTGLFSTQKMYQTFQDLLAKKLNIHGRPVLFSDLPHKLKMVSSMVNTDLPADSPLREQIDGDGRFVFSSDSTPNFDVAGALVSSAAVPAFFQLPQMLIAKPGENGKVERSRMQLADGGVVDNLSLSSANSAEKHRALVVLPAHTQARNPETGELVALDTLNFSTEHLDIIDAHNRELYKNFVPKLDDYFQRLKGHGVERAVLGFNLARPSQQPLPAIQGSSEELSLLATIHAKEIGLPVVEKEKGDSLIAFTQRPPNLLTDALGDLFDRYIDNRPGEGDGSGTLHRNQDGFHYHPPADETADLFEMGYRVGGLALSASDSEYAQRRFEKVS